MPYSGFGEGVKETTGVALKSADPLQKDRINFEIIESRMRNKMTVTKKKFQKI